MLVPDPELFALTVPDKHSRSEFVYGSEIKWNYISSHNHSLKLYGTFDYFVKNSWATMLLETLKKQDLLKNFSSSKLC
jgi:hypothetical protein